MPCVLNPKNAAGVKLVVVVLIVMFLECRKTIIKTETTAAKPPSDNKELS